MTDVSSSLSIYLAIISAGAGLLGVSIGGWINSKNDKARRQAEFLEKQLSEFYGPLLGIRTEIKARSNLREVLGNATGRAWHRLTSSNEEWPQRLATEMNKLPEFGQQNVHEWEAFREITMPLYRRMIQIFRDKMSLADQDTRGYFDELLMFIDIWERHIAKKIPPEVIEETGHSEERLKPFYAHLEKKVGDLQSRLAGTMSKACG